MKQFIKTILLCACVAQAIAVSAQSIRKDYREMTATEKSIYRAALDELGPVGGGSNAVGAYSNNHFSLTTFLSNASIHSNPHFLPWHRWFILYFEKELQSTAGTVVGANKIAIPYWDWPSDNSNGAALWTSFLNGYPSSWSFSRPLPSSTFSVTQAQINTLLENINYESGGFRPSLEGHPHNNAHAWVGGVMNSMNSPTDPAFYLHHAGVDRIWQEWSNFTGNNSYSFTVSPFPSLSGAGANVKRFPVSISTPVVGTLNVAVPGAEPSETPNPVNPNTIADGRHSSLKTWYAESGKVVLDRYTCSGTENYYYTGLIEAGSRVTTTRTLTSTTRTYNTGDFIVPSGATVKFVSGGLAMNGTAAGYIRLVPGFQAQSGSSFIAKIDADYFNNASHSARALEPSAARSSAPTLDDLVSVYPNPSSGEFHIEMPADLNDTFNFSITDSFGSTVLKGKSNEVTTKVNTTGLAPGIHILKITTVGGAEAVKRVVIH